MGSVFIRLTFSSVQSSCSVVSDSLRPLELQQARPPCSITNSRSSLRLASIESVMPSSHLILGRPLLLLPPVPPSIKVFSKQTNNNETVECLKEKILKYSMERKKHILKKEYLIDSKSSNRGLKKKKFHQNADRE